jgi:hypothetical protein
MNSSLKWLRIGAKIGFLAIFDADSGVFWEAGGVCVESSVAHVGAFWVNIVITVSPLFWGK